jgi:hypothetical protein
MRNKLLRNMKKIWFSQMFVSILSLFWLAYIIVYSFFFYESENLLLIAHPWKKIKKTWMNDLEKAYAQINVFCDYNISFRVFYYKSKVNIRQYQEEWEKRKQDKHLCTFFPSVLEFRVYYKKHTIKNRLISIWMISF